MSATEMRKLMEAIQEASALTSSTFDEFKADGPMAEMDNETLQYWLEEWKDEYNRQKTAGNEFESKHAYGMYNTIDAELDGRQEYSQQYTDYDDPHGDRDPSPEDQAGWAFQDKYDRYKNEY